MRFALLILAVTGICTPVSADYNISRIVLANGGGTAADSETRVTCTVGQAAIGPSAGAGYAVGSGFWYLADQVCSGIEEGGEEPPERFALALILGNPQHSRVTLLLAVPQRAHVAIELYDIAGRRLRTPVDTVLEPGHHRAYLDAAGLSSGVYFCRMRAPNFSEVQRLVLLE